MTEGSLYEQLAAFAGQEAGPARRAPDPVNQPMIRHWVEAMGDDNPVYVDEKAAAESVHREVIAPPVMLQAWIMPGLQAEGLFPAGSPRAEILRLLDEHGFTSVVATNCEQTYHRMLHLGDHLSCSTVIESISPEKQTALGAGHFFTELTEYRDDSGELVAEMRFRMLKFRPRESDPSATEPVKLAPTAKPPRPRPALTHDNAFFFEGAKEHKLLIQRCASCGRLRHPPRPMCPFCRSLDWDTVEARGRGTVYSFVVNHHPQVPAFDYPLAVALVELEEGTRLVSDIVGIDPADVTIGMPVEVEFVAVDNELTLPMFRPAAGRNGAGSA